MTDKTHARCSASAAHRWFACPGSVALGENVPEKTSVYATEGTQAHDLAEACLRLDCDPAEVPGDYTEEQVEGVRLYRDEVQTLSKTGKMYFELQLDALAGLHESLGGTADCVCNSGEILTVLDFKFGRTPVKAKGNPQLLLYAVGAVMALNAKPNEIHYGVFQPRVNPHPQYEVISRRDLKLWRSEILLPNVQAANQPGAPLHLGDHCRFCRAMAVCPLQQKNALDVARTGLLGQPPAPETLTPDQIGKVLTAADMISEWAGKVRGYAQSFLEGGQTLPGWKLVAKRSNRRWSHEEAATAALEKHLAGEAYEKKILSPAKAEKALKKAGIDPASVVDPLTEKPDAGLVIAPESDARPAVVAQPFLERLEMFD